MNYGLIKNYNAGGVIAARTIVKFGADDKTVVAAAAATDKLLGVTCDVDSSSGDPTDVAVEGIVPVISGGTITRGDLVTSDASGHAVTAAPAAGANNRIVGIAMASAVSGDIFDVMIGLAMLQG